MDRDFIGFSFGGVSSEELGITRVSSGDRYEEQLHPEIKDITAEVPGLNGEYYFGSDFGNRTFDIEFAFDHMTEEQFRKLRQVFGTKQIQKLIFEERPYKYYMAKIESPIELSYVCFDERKRVEDSQRDGVRIVDRTTSSSTTSTVTTSSEGLEVSLNEEIFQSVFVGDGNYQFIYHNSIWYYVENEVGEEAEVDLASYGISVVLPESSEEEISFIITTITTTDTEIQWKQVTPWKYLDVTERIYKGEGKVTFVCYFPFAKSVYKILPGPESEDYSENISDWASSSGILSAEDYNSADLDTYGANRVKIEFTETKDVEAVIESDVKLLQHCSENGSYKFIYNSNDGKWYLSGNQVNLEDYGITVQIIGVGPEISFTIEIIHFNGFKVYNAGDIPVGFRLYCPFSASTSLNLSYRLFEQDTSATLVIDTITPETNQTGELDLGFLINTDNGLIQGIQEITPGDNFNTQYITSGNIYNQYITAGYFFKLEPNMLVNEANLDIVDKDGDLITGDVRIFYDYLYF